ncbi:MAG: hypothetical protein ACTS6J_18120 [Burkholderiales bacterium]
MDCAASIGVTHWCGPKDTLNVMLGRADAALYQAKAQGRNHIYVGRGGWRQACAAPAAPAFEQAHGPFARQSCNAYGTDVRHAHNPRGATLAHMTFRVTDIQRAKALYSAALAPLGYSVSFDSHYGMNILGFAHPDSAEPDGKAADMWFIDGPSP